MRLRGSLSGTVRTASAVLVSILVATVGVTGAARAATTVDNAGFENGLAGWSERGDRAASFVEAGGHTGANRLSHWSSSTYRVETNQRLTRLDRGVYTLTAWVRSGGGQRAAWIALTDCGGPDRRVDVPRSIQWWVQVAISTVVTSGRCTVRLYSDADAGQWANVDDVTFTRSDGRAGAPVQIKGADISQLQKNEDHGAVYRDRSGRRDDAVRILRANGVNWARLKVWVNPPDGYSDKAHVLAMARRVKAAGMKLLVDFHYSDAWADPGKQNKPAAWAELPFDQLRQAMYDHTFDVISSLRRQGTPPAMAQVGNEINGGLLWPDGRWDNWDGLAALLTAGSTAVKAASPSTQVALHLAEGADNGGHRWWFDNAVSRGVPFDVIALSHYVYWHGPLGALQANLFDLSTRYGKPIALVETAYGFTVAENDHQENIFNPSLEAAGGYPATPQGQAEATRDMFNVVAAVPGTLGVFYWEPTWTAVTGGGWDPYDPTSGDGWENQALFDYTGRALPALRVFDHF